jgi:hypothetical protein
LALVVRFRVILPTLQCATRILAFAAARRLPTTLGTMHRQLAAVVEVAAVVVAEVPPVSRTGFPLTPPCPCPEN